ncbi:MAG: hypothetical protein OEV31_04560 [Gammaproteobacteria bacterium]|nr:hypothetical protein [Gammaproteobacteria bacterium]
MRAMFQSVTSSLARRINSLVHRAESAHPGMDDVAAMVYVGDVYALREQSRRRPSDGWGRYRYTCDSSGCRRLP